jgi:phage gpG-like protein
VTKQYEQNPDFDRQFQREVETNLLRPLAESVMRDAKRLCPVDTGHLSESITYEIVSWDEAIVGTDMDYAASVEFGSQPHTIRTRNAKVLTDGKKVFGTVVHHPGTPAQPYLRPALYRERGLA